MMKILFLFLFLSLEADVFFFNGKTYDDDSVSHLITVITSTSPIPSMPSTEYLYEAQKSLFQVPALAKCKKIVVFDGLKDRRLLKQYNEYKKNVERLVKEDLYFANTTLIFCLKWGHLTGTIREAIRHVTTPYLFIHQHDLVLLRSFDLNGVVASMEANPRIKYVYLGRRPNTVDDFYHAPVDEGVEGISFIPLCQSSGWSDQCHITSVDYYKNFVLPRCGATFMESVLHPALKEAIRSFGMEGREAFGTFLYGKLMDGPYILHTDGRNSSAK
jgi:hypothetical protein